MKRIRTLDEVGSQCIAKLFYRTQQSARKMADGEKRCMKGGRCLHPASYLDRYLDPWCGQHVLNPNVAANYGPFKRMEKP